MIKSLFPNPTKPCHSEARRILVIPKRAAQRNPLSRPAPLTSAPVTACDPTLPPHPPERTHPKPGKRHCETNCNHHTAQPRPPGVIFRIFVHRLNPTTQCHQQENQPRNLQ